MNGRLELDESFPVLAANDDDCNGAETPGHWSWSVDSESLTHVCCPRHAGIWQKLQAAGHSTPIILILLLLRLFVIHVVAYCM